MPKTRTPYLVTTGEVDLDDRGFTIRLTANGPATSRRLCPTGDRGHSIVSWVSVRAAYSSGPVGGVADTESTVDCPCTLYTALRSALSDPSDG